MGKNKMINVAIIDDNRIVRLGVKSLISTDNINVIGEASNGVDGVEMVFEMRPDLLLLDMYMPDITGIEVCRRVLEKLPEMKIIFVTECQNLATLCRLLKTGAHGLIRKAGSFMGREAILSVFAGKTFVQPDIVHDLISYQCQNHPLDLLTDIEHEVMLSVVNGKSQKEIAKALNLSTLDVDNLLSSAKEKLAIADLSSLEALVDPHPDNENFPEIISKSNSARMSVL